MHSLQGLLRQRDGKLAQTDSLLAQATHSGQLLGRNEASDAEKVHTAMTKFADRTR